MIYLNTSACINNGRLRPKSPQQAQPKVRFATEPISELRLRPIDVVEGACVESNLLRDGAGIPVPHCATPLDLF